MRTIAAALTAIPLLALAAGTACGGSSSGQPAGSVKVVLADFSFTPSDIQAKAGSPEFYLVNEGKASHDMTIMDASGKELARSELVQPGNTAVFDTKLSAGSYKVICSQPGHADAGMRATLTVS
ncbi:MAG TPA: cupredoxin domain-containing protein [Candidatus Dormibacteraeota bacterium]